jgi:3'(2'), 5'-bisphosphate nucleotidase
LPADLGALLAVCLDAARRAGAAIMEVYAQDFAVRRKDDASPVTLADEHAEKIIAAALRAAAPGVVVVAEEECEAGGIPGHAPERFWLVDPLDGTKEFINRNGEFTVNIALIEQGAPVLGVVLVPVTGVLYAAAGAGTAQCWHGTAGPEPIAVRRPPPEGLTIVHSRSHENNAALDAYLADKRVAAKRVCGSSVKLCLIAAGEADVYPRFGPTMEWDIAAGHAVLLGAGGSVTTHDGATLRYGKPGFRNPGFIARGL